MVVRVGSHVDGNGSSGGGDRGGVEAVRRLVLGFAPAQRIQDLPQPTSENSVNAKFRSPPWANLGRCNVAPFDRHPRSISDALIRTPGDWCFGTHASRTRPPSDGLP